MAGLRLGRRAREVVGVAVAQEVVGGGAVVGQLREPRSQSTLTAPSGQGDDRRTVRLTMAVPRELHRRLKLAAVRQERTIVSLVSGWIEERTAAA